MGFDESSTLSNEALSSEALTVEEYQKSEIGLVSNALENLNFVDRNITELKRELSSLDKEEIFDTSQNIAESDPSYLDKGHVNFEVENEKELRDDKLNGAAPKQSPQESAPEHVAFGLEGIFDAMKGYYNDKSPFLPTGRLDTESLKQKLLQENQQPMRNLDEDSIFFHRSVLNSNYGKTPSFKATTLPKLSLETFFYIFYNVSRDTLQQMAANELFKREWKYHETNKLWFKHDDKKSTWMYFDPTSWSTRNLNITPEVEKCLMSRPDLEKLLEGQE